MSNEGDKWYSDNKKLQVVTSYLILGRVSEVARMYDIPAQTIYRWKSEPWFKEMVDQIRSDEDTELDGKLAKRIERALDVVEDRLVNGNYFIDKRTGELIRKPVDIKDAWKVNKEMIDIRLVLRKEKPVQQNQEAVAEVLTTLAKEFAQMAKKRVEEKLNVQESKPEVPNASDEKGQVLDSNG